MTGVTVEAPHCGRLVATIAPHLGSGPWEIVPPGEEGDDRLQASVRCAEADGEERPALWFNVRSYPRPYRLTVGCRWPSQPGRDYRDFQPRDTAPFHITVSPDLPPEKIARDITRRLVVRYLMEWDTQIGRFRAALAREEAARRVALDLAEAVGAEARILGREGWKIYGRRTDEAGRCTFTVSLYGGISCEVDFGEPPEVAAREALAFALWMNARRRPRPEPEP